MARIGDGLVVDPDLVGAAERAVAQALAPLHGAPLDLACVFVRGEEPHAAAAALQRAAALLAARTVVGCSASGVIGGGRGVEAESAVSVFAAVLPGARARGFHLAVLRSGEGLAVAGMPERGADDVAGILLADPYSFPVDGFVERSHDALGGLPLVGGLALGGRGPGSTRLMVDGRVVDRGAVGVLLGGPVAARPLVSQGCRPVGPPMTVTAAEGNVLLELAGVPAATKVREVVAALPPEDRALASVGLQFGIAIDEYAEEHGPGDFLVRGIAGVDPDRDALVVGDLVPVGRTVRLQVRDAAAADADLRDVLTRFQFASGAPVEGALLVSCNGRGSHLFPSADHDVATVRSVLRARGVGGFFAGGEIGSVGGRNHVHGFTASLLAFASGTPHGSGTPPGSGTPRG